MGHDTFEKEFSVSSNEGRIASYSAAPLQVHINTTLQIE